MGLKSSPYQACQAMGFAEEVIRGSRRETNNVFRWDRVRMNLPGSDEYDPSLPWVSKVRKCDGRIAADVVTFVDDSPPLGPTKEDAWDASRKTASILGHLGLQDNPRKRRDSTQTPGAWAGGVVRTDEGYVTVLVLQDKWDKLKSMLAELQEMVASRPEGLNRQRLEQIREFIIYVVQTYPTMKPYLIGLHMPIDGWRSNRDAERWRLFLTASQTL
jgi:hypothetical protein